MPEIFDGLSVIFFHNIAIAVLLLLDQLVPFAVVFISETQKKIKTCYSSYSKGHFMGFYDFSDFFVFFFSKGYIPVHPSIYSFCMKLILKVGIQTPGYFEAMRN